MDIRKLRAEDWQILKCLIFKSSTDSPDAFAEEAPCEPSSNEDCFIWRDYAKKYSGVQRDIAYVLFDNIEPCGILIGNHCGGVANIGRLWISPSKRRNKNGQNLIDGFLSWARDRHALVVRLYVNEEKSAIKFYESIGFKRTEKKETVSKGSTIITMIEVELKL